MTRGKRPPNRQQVLQITPGEKEALERLYYSDGAWTHSEAVTFLGEARFRKFMTEGLLGQQDTDMGPMYHLLAKGRFVGIGKAGNPSTLSAQLDMAYLRLSLKELNWSVVKHDSPYYKNYDSIFKRPKFYEAMTRLGHVMLGAKISGGGYSVQGIEELAKDIKSNALAHNILFVILTPHPRRGQQVAHTHRSVLRLTHHLPRVDGSQRSRFNPVKPSKTAPDPSPIITPSGAQRQRERGVLPDLTLDILQLARKDRIEQAQAALDVDGVMSEGQLKRYYGLRDQDLTGRLVTQAILRPSKNRGNHEVQQQVIVANKQLARLDDSALNHRLLTTQLRHDLGLAPDPERWQIEPRNGLKLENPDVMYVTEDGERWAIEADTGHYQMSTILRKLQTFRDQEYAKTIWGVPSAVRIKNLTRKIERDLRPTLRLTEWW